MENVAHDLSVDTYTYTPISTTTSTQYSALDNVLQEGAGHVTPVTINSTLNSEQKPITVIMRKLCTEDVTLIR